MLFVMKILLDNGHGYNTPGKRSPDERLREYVYTRQITLEIDKELKKLGYDSERIVIEDNDVSLTARCNRVNKFCDKLGASNVILISVHVNAAGNGGWLAARGWCAYTSKGKTKSDELAEHLYMAAEKYLEGHKIRRDKSDGDADQEANFTVLAKTKCPAVLTENLFQDNKEDVNFLLSAEGRKAIVDLHVQGIISYIKAVKG